MAELTNSKYTLSQYLKAVTAFLSNREDQQYSESRKRFMCEDNIKLIVLSIIRAVKTKLNITLELNNISPYDLSIIMRSIFIQNALNDDSRVEEDVDRLNKIVSKECIHIIISAIKNYNWVQSNIDRETGYQIQQPLIDMPKNTHTFNQLYNPIVLDETTNIGKPHPGGNRSRPRETDRFFIGRVYNTPKATKTNKLFKVK
jgi:hypothetical protein